MRYEDKCETKYENKCETKYDSVCRDVQVLINDLERKKIDIMRPSKYVNDCFDDTIAKAYIFSGFHGFTLSSINVYGRYISIIFIFIVYTSCIDLKMQGP